MILTRVQKYSKPIVVSLCWLMSMQIILPAFASVNKFYPSVKFHNFNRYKKQRGIVNTAAFSEHAQEKPAEEGLSEKETRNISTGTYQVDGGGPGQPEMASFKSAGTTNLVDPFTGDFSYNIPLLDVGGYPVNIHYNSNITMDQEASWVGLGWNINPGTIGRSMRGLPDDFNGDDQITKTISTKPNVNLGLGVAGGLELFGKDIKGISHNYGVTYDNYKGFGIESGISIKSPIRTASKTAGGIAGSLSFTNSSTSGVSIDAGLSFSSKLNELSKVQESGDARSSIFGGTLNYSSRAGLSSFSVNANMQTQSQQGTTSFSIPGSMTFNRPSFTPSSEIPYTSYNFSFTANTGVSFAGLFGNFGINGSYSRQFIQPKDITKKYPAFGYLHFSKADGNRNALLDFNRENDGTYVDKITPAISIPNYTYDVYTISAEGTGGSFRPYRSDVGYVYSPFSRSSNAQLSIGFDIGLNHVGVNGKPVYSTTTTNAWISDNKLKNVIGFQQKDSVFEDVVFRNPMEMPVQSERYLNAIGHDTLIRPILEGTEPAALLGNGFTAAPNGINALYNISHSKPVVKDKREKRNQVISYLTAEEASLYGLDRQLHSYAPDYLPFAQCETLKDTAINRIDGQRSRHHLSEITVLNNDGRRYIYGVPVYTLKQHNITFSVVKKAGTTDILHGLTEYDNIEESVNNPSGVEGYYSKEEIPAYAHSFLLSGILSPDYVDITNDGISDDDMGDAVKFGYTRMYNSIKPFRWRTPTPQSEVEDNRASFNEGLKTYSRDDKANIIYGEKELWYLKTISSKNFVAVFKTVQDRSDGKSVISVKGGLDDNKKLAKLERIDLYTKADLVARGANAKPVKSVHFTYDFSLCPGAEKLTLKSIHFTYNGSTKKSNTYKFAYNGANPSYKANNSDVWGNYKYEIYNPGGLSNREYPYIVQTTQTSTDLKAVADYNASAWCLTDVRLPSGGALKVVYESDDYGYVQNKRAMQLYAIAGVGSSPSDGVSNLKQSLYKAPDRFNKGFEAYNYVFIDVKDAVFTKADVLSKYLEGIRSFYLKFHVTMPGVEGGREFIPMVCDVDDYGIVANGTNKRIWVKIKDTDGKSTLVHYALQFLKENLPSKAYPGSETGDNPDPRGLVNMLASQFTNIKQSVLGFDTDAKIHGKCRDFAAASSFIKLNNSGYLKYGGGSRVKEIRVSDKFDQMATGMDEATYGQVYDYTTKTSVTENGVTKAITISSGVATYEPFIGGEENALKGYYAYQQQLNKLGPVSFKFVDTPFCESMYPGASVGYSRVSIRTINNQYLSANGKEVYTYYTYKDFPTRFSFTPLDDNSRKRFKPAIANFLKINATHNLTLSQGFRVELNDMHGKLRTHEFYSESDLNNAMTYTENFYRTQTTAGKPMELDKKVWTVGGADADINQNAAMGQSVEIMADFREQSSHIVSPNIETNVDAIGFGLFSLPVPGWWILPQFEKTRFRSASVLKVVNNYGILDSVYHIDKGSVVNTKNLVYDSETGNVVLTRTNNEYKDPVYNYNYPAHWAYSGMGMAYKNIHATFKEVDIKNGRLFKRNTSELIEMKHFESGDECIVTGDYAPAGVELGDPECQFSDMSSVNFKTSGAWVLDANKNTGQAAQLFFISASGKPLNVRNARIKILRSGKRNFTESSVGNVTMLANPVVSSGSNLKISVANDRKVINSSAATFKDCWKVDNTVHAEDSCVTAYTTISEVRSATTTLLKRKHKGGSPEPFATYETSPSYAVASEDLISPRNCAHSVVYNTKAVLDFGLGNIPSNAIVDAAVINFTPTVPTSLWPSEFTDGFLCSPLYNYNWSATNQWRVSNYSTSLKRITGRFNTSFKYFDFNSIVTNTAKVSLPTNLPASMTSLPVNATALVNDVVRNPGGNGKIMFDLDGVGTSRTNKTIYLSFLANGCTGEYCNKPSMSLTYRVPKDTCYKVCKTNITDSINPYRWGVYGNWRPDRSYVVYSERNESNPAAGTDIRKDGALKDFTPFWTGTNVSIKPTVDTVKWVWNSSSTKVNSKGAEVENMDALGRYNSGQYGYNNNLPVAVTQNSRFGESVFDGFEDYKYKSKFCEVLCPDPRYADFRAGGGVLDTLISHTGLYSLKFANTAMSELQFSLRDFNTDTLKCGVTTKVDSNLISGPLVTGIGTGLNLQIFDRNDSSLYNSAGGASAVDFTASYYDETQQGLANGFSASWSGYIQPKYSGLYSFPVSFKGDGMQVYVNNTLVNSGWGETENQSQIYLTQGSLNTISVMLYNYGAYYPPIESYIKMNWLNDNEQSSVLVPETSLYTNQSTAGGTVTNNNQKVCITMSAPVSNNVLLPSFGPQKTGDIIVSAWIRESQPCSGTAYANTKLQLSFDNTTTPVNLLPTGVIIEGWQRMEAAVAIPQGAAKLKLKMFSQNNAMGFNVDDIRIHPYNANMKSFVYNPVNLRLMAELDENNYASFYEYDDEGTLVRVKKETEKGIQTIKETRSAQTKGE